jgi:hypothetical protein
MVGPLLLMDNYYLKLRNIELKGRSLPVWISRFREGNGGNGQKFQLLIVPGLFVKPAVELNRKQKKRKKRCAA